MTDGGALKMPVKFTDMSYPDAEYGTGWWGRNWVFVLKTAGLALLTICGIYLAADGLRSMFSDDVHNILVAYIGIPNAVQFEIGLYMAAGGGYGLYRTISDHIEG